MKQLQGYPSRPVLWRTYLEDFPNLQVAMVADFNQNFNCIAWSIGVTDRWVWNEVDLNEDGTANLGEFINFYRKHGYKPVFNEANADVALFALKFGQGYKVTHAAKRNKRYPNRSIWQSKMGQGGIIEHKGLSVFKDSPYGDPIALFRRE
jgi:hypothetical protein